jgi:hypothetical protein
MTRDEVIKALECCIVSEIEWECPKECPRFSKSSGKPCEAALMCDALALLKAQPKMKAFGLFGFTAHSSEAPEYPEERKQMAEHLAKDMAIQLLQEGLIQITEHDRENTPMDEDFYPDGFNAVIGAKIKIEPPYGWKEIADE